MGSLLENIKGGRTSKPKARGSSRVSKARSGSKSRGFISRTKARRRGGR